MSRKAIIFVGRRQKWIPFVTVNNGDGVRLLPRHEEFMRFSSQPFAWGVRSPAAEQLAYAMCVESFGIEPARRVCSQIYIGLISTLASDVWEISSDRLHDIVREDLKVYAGR